MIKAYRTIQHWNQWLAEPLGHCVLESQKKYLTSQLADRYGKHVLLVGVPHQAELLKCSVMSNQVLLSPIINKQKHEKCIDSEYLNLPIIPGSADLVIVPHTLELLDNPRQLLSEACRIVKPEGLIMIFGFNPLSLWGMRKWLAKNKNMPWSNNFTSANTVKNWLKLADFELVKQDMLLFRPPVTHSGVFKKLSFLEWVGKKIFTPFGGVYVLIAQAKSIPLIPIKMRWKQKLTALHATSIPGPSMRDIQSTEKMNEKYNRIH